MACYENFAQIYDFLMEDVDYNKWANYLNDIIIRYNNNPKYVLDLACGTGNITIPMSELGYNVWGIDISEQMLAIAESKSRAKGKKVKFIRQDMRYLQLTNNFDVVICACDGINYITAENELLNVFQGVYNILNEGGVFVFDISSLYKLKYIIGNNTFVEEKNHIFYCWENDFDEESSIVTMRLNFFIRHGKIYRRIEELHIQKAYSIKTIYNLLNKCGFKHIEIFNEFTFDKAYDESERIFFITKKI